MRDIARASPVPVPASESAGPDAPPPRLADLLPREWVDKLAQGPSASSKSFGASGNYSIGLRGSHAPLANPAMAGGIQGQQNAAEHLQHQHPIVIDSYYPGHIPGFVVGCTSDMMDECFKR